MCLNTRTDLLSIAFGNLSGVKRDRRKPRTRCTNHVIFDTTPLKHAIYNTSNVESFMVGLIITNHFSENIASSIRIQSIKTLNDPQETLSRLVIHRRTARIITY